MKISMFTAGGSFRGEYDSEETYRVKDIVRYDGHAYQAIADSFTGEAPTETAYWSKIVNAPVYSGLTATQADIASATTTGHAAGTRKYWFGQEWELDLPSAKSARLKKVYQNCNCNCHCVQNCNCPANQPNMGNCSDCSWISDLRCNCACLLQSDCNYASGYCNCTALCADGNCYF